MGAVTMYSRNSRVGMFRIRRMDDGRWHVWCDDEDLGSYHSAPAALGDLCGGHTYSLACGVDTSTLGLPDELRDWTAWPPQGAK